MLPPASAIYRDSYRVETEDRIGIFPAAESVVVAIADGVGGRANGGAAADVALRRVEEYVAAPRRKGRGVADWQRFLDHLDREIHDKDACGETTLVVVEISPTRLIGASVGDSEAWLIRPDGHFDLTSRQISKPFLGSGAADVVPFHLNHPGMGTLVAASDGLFKYATTQAIEDAALDADLLNALKRLGDLPRLRSGSLPDDLAIGAVRLDNRLDRLQRRAMLSRWLGEAPWVPTSDSDNEE